MFNPLFLCVYFDKIPLGVPEKRKLFGEEEKGMKCLL
ncbi:unknown [Eubacterium sp. CAG:251]|nr:unknown [Eubacterium sp. CAG:251]